MSVRVRDAPVVSWGYPKRLRLKTYPFGPDVPRFWYRLVVEVPVLVLMETTTPELPRDLEDAAVGTPVARPVVSSPTPAIHLGYGETMASIGQSVVGEAPCISLVEVAAEQILEAIYIVPVVPVTPAPEFGLGGVLGLLLLLAI